MQKIVTIVDYGLGNIFSVNRAFSSIGCHVQIANTPEQILSAQFLVLPGVGAFIKGMQELSNRNLIESILIYAQSKRPLLGICLGMQLLFEFSEENGHTPGLSLLPGKVIRIVPSEATIKVPHIGWSRLQVNSNHSQANQYRDISDKYAYFVHSYHPLPKPEHLLATTVYHSHSINSIVMHQNLIGCQFHPEKSGDNFMKFLKDITLTVSEPCYL